MCGGMGGGGGVFIYATFEKVKWRNAQMTRRRNFDKLLSFVYVCVCPCTCVCVLASVYVVVCTCLCV